jgi:RNA polymerase sigma-70 factor (ECF subfamily)
MEYPHASKTSVTLLQRLRDDPQDETAWSEFVRRYGPKILLWARRWGLQEADAEDVTQDVLLKLNRKMASFTYDPARSFRGWLKTMAHHVWIDLVRERRREGMAVGGGQMDGFLSSLEAGDNLAEELQKVFRREVMERAMERVRELSAPQAWEVFRLTALEHWSGAAVAAHLGIPDVGRVYLVKSRVTQRVREEARRLGKDHFEDPSP